MAKKVTQKEFIEVFEAITGAHERGEQYAKDTRGIATNAQGTANAAQSRADKMLNTLAVVVQRIDAMEQFLGVSLVPATTTKTPAQYKKVAKTK